jgi:hypothetical protein
MEIHQILISKIKGTIIKLFFHPEYYRMINKNSLRWLKGKFIYTFSGSPRKNPGDAHAPVCSVLLPESL